MNDRLLGLSYILASVVLESVGQVALKQSADGNPGGLNVIKRLVTLRDKLLAVGIACFLLEFCTWTLALHRLDVSLAYQLGCLSYVGVVLLSSVWLSEQMDRYKWIGLVCILSGSILVSTS
jgi:multidrug transporter EmrE-like cation transporter